MFKRRYGVFWGLLFCSLNLQSFAKDLNQNNETQAQSIETARSFHVPMGHLKVLKFQKNITKFQVGDPELLQIEKSNSKDLIVTGKQDGETNLFIWFDSQKEPQEYQLKIKPHFYNQQIAIRVKFLEVETQHNGEVGIDWSDFILIKEAPPNAPFKLGLPLRPTTLQAILNTLISDRKAKILANPTLVLANNKTATFNSGGKIPGVTSTQLNLDTEYHDYGVSLTITANIQSQESIQLDIEPSIKELDLANSSTFTKGNIAVNQPAFLDRTLKTSVVLKNNQPLVIGGIKLSDKEEIQNKLPILGEIPFLGMLFTSTTYRNVNREMVFIVTPSILDKSDTVFPESSYGQR